MATIFRNASLFDGVAHRGQVGDITVVDGVIVSVGESGGNAPAIGEIVDLGGALLSPGFVDAHVHPVQGGLERIRCDLTSAADVAGYLRVIAAHVADRDPDWVLGGGWSMSAFPGGTPTAAALDTVTGQRPAFLANRDHHGAWVNSAALRLAGIDRNTPDPADGRIERDADGAPTGTLHEGAMHLIEHLLPPTSPGELRRGLLAGQDYLHSVGVTGWQDAIIGSYSGMGDFGPTYLAAATAGELRSHVVGALWWDRDAGIDQIDDLVERRNAYTCGNFRPTTVKVMADGVAENFTASMLAPYLDRCGHASDNHGTNFVDPDTLAAAVPLLDEAGFQIHVHAIGDGAVRSALDAFEAVRGSRHRHHIAHLQVIHPDDVPRFAALGVTANLQALWACLDDQVRELTIPFLGPERAGWQYPFGDLVGSGASLCAGSDWPVSTADPIQAMHVAVNRWAYDDPIEPFLPDQALDLATIWSAYTAGSARINGLDLLPVPVGRIKPGYRADLAVIDRDPFVAPADQIGAAQVAQTWIAGVRIV